MMAGSEARAIAALGIPALLIGALLVFGGPLTQDPDYHAFADTRAWAGVPRAGDVLSSLGFVLVGVTGFGVALRSGGGAPVERVGWPLFFLCVALTGLGSAYYHWAPDDARLVWDRLPMAPAFASLIVLLIAERVSPRAATLALAPAVLLAFGSVLWWKQSGDLRPYVAVQAYALLSLPLLVWLVPDAARRPSTGWWALIGLYVLAKVAEQADATSLALLGVSGHTLKHSLAALAIAMLVPRLRRRAA